MRHVLLMLSIVCSFVSESGPAEARNQTPAGMAFFIAVAPKNEKAKDWDMDVTPDPKICLYDASDRDKKLVCSGKRDCNNSYNCRKSFPYTRVLEIMKPGDKVYLKVSDVDPLPDDEIGEGTCRIGCGCAIGRARHRPSAFVRIGASLPEAEERRLCDGPANAAEVVLGFDPLNRGDRCHALIKILEDKAQQSVIMREVGSLVAPDEAKWILESLAEARYREYSRLAFGAMDIWGAVVSGDTVAKLTDKFRMSTNDRLKEWTLEDWMNYATYIHAAAKGAMRSEAGYSASNTHKGENLLCEFAAMSRGSR